MNTNSTNKRKQFFTTALLIALSISLCGCKAIDNESERPLHFEESDTVSSADNNSDTKSKILTNTQIGTEIAKKWAGVWSKISAENMMALPKVSVFSADLTKDFDNVVVLVYPEYKTSRALLYGVKNTEIVDIGNIPSGWQFEVMDNGTDKLLHVVYMLSGAGGMREIDDNYYKISADGAVLVNSYGRTEHNGTATAWFRYEKGSPVEITIDEYISSKLEITDEYAIIRSIDFDKDADFTNDNSFDFSENTDGFSEYITKMIDTNE